MSPQPTHSRAEALTPAPQHVMVQADKAFKEAIQMRSLGWSPDSKGPASTGETGFGTQPGPEGRPRERKPRGGPRGTPGPQAAAVHARPWVLPCRPGQRETVSRAEHRGRATTTLWSSLTKPGQLAAPPASLGRAGRGGGQGQGRTSKANDMAGVEGGIRHRVF